MASPQKYNTTMSWQQLIAAVNADMTALYANSGGTGTVTSVGLTAGSADIVLGGTNPVTTNGNISIDLSASVKTALGEAGTALQSISIATGTGLTGGPLGASGSTVALNSTSIADLALAASSLQPVTGLGGSYTYASLTINSSGQITAVNNGTAPAASANPTGTVGLAAVNGSAPTFMRSDGAPELSQAIIPTWTALHKFNAGVNVTAASGSTAVIANGVAGSSVATFYSLSGATQSSGDVVINRAAGSTANAAAEGPNIVLYDGTYTSILQQSGGQTELYQTVSGSTVQILKFLSSGGAQFAHSIGVNGNAPPSQVTGWGTPTGASVVANFNGASASLVNCSNAIAEIITILKACGIIGA